MPRDEETIRRRLRRRLLLLDALQAVVETGQHPSSVAALAAQLGASNAAVQKDLSEIGWPVPRRVRKSLVSGSSGE